MLQQGCAALQVSVDAHQQERLLDYLALLSRWNRTYNLTAVRDEAQMVTRHLLDSLAIAPYLTGQRFLDVGTGAGLPGVPMALLFPHAGVPFAGQQWQEDPVSFSGENCPLLG